MAESEEELKSFLMKVKEENEKVGLNLNIQKTLRVGNGQGGLACCASWGLKGSDMTERLNWTELNCLCSLWRWHIVAPRPTFAVRNNGCIRAKVFTWARSIIGLQFPLLSSFGSLYRSFLWLFYNVTINSPNFQLMFHMEKDNWLRENLENND